MQINEVVGQCFYLLVRVDGNEAVHVAEIRLVAAQRFNRYLSTKQVKNALYRLRRRYGIQHICFGVYRFSGGGT